MHPSDTAAAFAALAADLQREPDEDVTAVAIVDRLEQIVPEADEVSLTVRARRGRHETLAATGELSRQADGLQYALDEGPCLEAADDEASWLRSGDVRDDRRWRRWGPEAGALGVASLLSVRLLSEAKPHGALNLYSRKPGAFADRDIVDLVLVYAVHAANALASAHLATGLQTAISSRHTIGMAQGILMERYGLDPQRSFELLRRVSSTTNTKVQDLADVLVTTGALPETAHDGQGDPLPQT